jgi:hypothetical protein
MPAKLPTPGPIPPAIRLFLLTGLETPAARISGWYDLLVAGQYGRPTLNDLLAEHHATLAAEAQAAGFEPYFARHKKPTGPVVQRWIRAFTAEHEY